MNTHLQEGVERHSLKEGVCEIIYSVLCAGCGKAGHEILRNCISKHFLVSSLIIKKGVVEFFLGNGVFTDNFPRPFLSLIGSIPDDLRGRILCL